MYRPTPTPQQMLTHSEVPGYSGLFILGFQERHVNFYSQQVRALNLALALELLGRLVELPDDSNANNTRPRRVCVVGGGAGGAMAAVAFALCGCDVTLFERKKDLFPHPYEQPSAASERFQRTIHPHLMHWPYITGQGENAGLPFMDWTAAEIGVVLGELRRRFGDIAKTIHPERLQLNLSTVVHSIRRKPLKDDVSKKYHATFDVSYAKVVERKAEFQKDVFDLVILATGFNGERSYPNLKTMSYWDNGLLAKLQDVSGNVLVLNQALTKREPNHHCNC